MSVERAIALKGYGFSYAANGIFSNTGRVPHKCGCPTFAVRRGGRLRWDIYNYCLLSIYVHSPV